MNSSIKSFTIIELLIVLGVISILSAIAVVVLNPAELLKQGRDSTRIQDIRGIDTAINLGRAINPSLLDNTSSSIVYISLPDTDADTLCNEYSSLPNLETPWEYRCTASSTVLQSVDGTGWIPIDFTSIAGGANISVLPIDPVNKESNNRYYTYSLISSDTFSLSSALESQKYLGQIALTDGGNSTSSFETAPIAWTTTSVPADWYDTNWNYRKTITIQSGQVSNGPHTNFPMLVSIASDSDLVANIAQSNGGDIIFTNEDGTIKFAHETTKYTSATGELTAWVNVNSINDGIVIYMYYGNSSGDLTYGLTTTEKAAAWNNNYMGVWHLDETAGTHYDSTSNNNDSSSVNVITQGQTTSAKIGGADQIGSASQMTITIPDNATLDFNTTTKTNMTMEVWINISTLSSISNGILSKGGGGLGAGRYWFNFSTDNCSGDFLYNYYANLNCGTGIPDVGNWQHVAYTYNHANTLGTAYRNGDAAGTVTKTSNAADIAANFIIGQARSNGLDGYIDEVRISDINRSQGWLKTGYNSQNSPSTFLSFGSEESI